MCCYVACFSYVITMEIRVMSQHMRICKCTCGARDQSTCTVVCEYIHSNTILKLGIKVIDGFKFLNFTANSFISPKPEANQLWQYLITQSTPVVTRYRETTAQTAQASCLVVQVASQVQRDKQPFLTGAVTAAVATVLD